MSTLDARMDAKVTLSPRQEQRLFESRSNADDMFTPQATDHEKAFGLSTAGDLYRGNGLRAGIDDSSITSGQGQEQETNEIKERKRVQAILRQNAAMQAIDARIAKIDIRLDEIQNQIADYTTRRQEIRFERAELEIERQQIQEQKEEIKVQIEQQEKIVNEAEVAKIEADEKVEVTAAQREATQRQIMGADDSTELKRAVDADKQAEAAHEEAKIEQVECDENLTRAQQIKAGYERALEEHDGRLNNINEEIEKLDSEDKGLEGKIAELNAEKIELEKEKLALEDPEFRARVEQGLVSEEEMRSILSESSYESFVSEMGEYVDYAVETVSDAVDSVTQTVSNTIDGVTEAVSDVAESITSTVSGIGQSVSAWWSKPVEADAAPNNIQVGVKDPSNMQCHFERSAAQEPQYTPIPALDAAQDMSSPMVSMRVSAGQTLG